MDEQRKPIEMPSADVADYSPEINALYDAQKAQQEQSLKTAYDQNVQTLQNSKQAIAPLYNQQANDLSTQFERTRRMNNMKADYNGLNTGAASQMDLAQQSNYLNSFGKLRTAQAQAEQAVDQKLADLEINYKNSVAQALADNDYQRAAALMKEYQRRDEATKEEQRYQYQIQTAAQQYADQYARQQEQDAFAREKYNNEWARQQERDALSDQRYENEWNQQLLQYQNQLARQQEQDAFAREQYQNSLAAQQWEQQYKERAYNDTMSQQQNEDAIAAAKTRAAYGDFSGYEALYGAETANAMKQFWAMNNPDYAYSMGLITADQYEQMTGYSPDRSSLYSSYSSGGSSGGSYRRSSSSSNSNNPNGPGAIDGQNPTTATNEPLSERDAYSADRAALLADIDRYGSEKGAYVARMQNQQMAAQGQAEMAAVANGLKPGTTAYRTFVAEQKDYILSTDPDYIANQKAVNALGEQQKLEEQKKQAAFEAQYGKAGTVSYDYNSQQSAADSEKAFASASTYTPTPAKNTSKSSNTTSASSQAGKEIRAKSGSGGNATTNKNANKTR